MYIMNYQFHLDHLTVIRNKFVEALDTLSLEKLLVIPQGCNNNMLWQIGHCAVSQQRLMYTYSGLPIHLDNAFVELFKIGTSPKNWTSTPDVAAVRAALISTVDHLKVDVENGVFKEYKSFKTSAGLVLNSFEEAFTYSNYHEGVHVGNLEIFRRIV